MACPCASTINHPDPELCVFRVVKDLRHVVDVPPEQLPERRSERERARARQPSADHPDAPGGAIARPVDLDVVGNHLEEEAAAQVRRHVVLPYYCSASPLLCWHRDTARD